MKRCSGDIFLRKTLRKTASYRAMSGHISNTSKQGPTSLVFTFIAPSLFSFCIGCISQVSSFHILFHRVFASFMAISHPFSQDHTFCRDLFFIFSQGISQVSSFHIFFPLFYQCRPISFSCFSLFISHTIYVKYSVKRGSPLHSFHKFFTGLFHIFFHIPVKNPVKYSVKTM